MSKVISNLKSSQQEIIQFFNLESLVSCPDSLVSEIVTWAGNNLWLTKYICQAIVDYSCFIPSGMEAVLVEKIVQERIIEDWQNKEIAVHLNQIQEYFSTQSESYSRSLLLTYLDIWQQGKVLLKNSRETQRLVELGLVTEQQNYFQVSNRLYQLIFNYDWVQEQLFAIKLINKTPSPQVRRKTSKNTFSSSLNNFTPLHNNPFAQIVAFMSLSGLGLIVSLIFFSIFETQLAPDIEIEQSRFEEQFLFPDEK